MKNLSLIILTFCCSITFAQLDSLGNLTYSANLNDVWGYKDELGNEYALVGLVDGFSVVDIVDPANPIEVFRAFGPETIWRDIKTYGDFAYVTNEGDSGIRIYDLSGLPGNTTIPYKNYSGSFGSEFTTAHNLYIDENGFAYIIGTNRSDETIILDLNPDPWNPIEVGAYSSNYLHDVYVENDTMYGSAISLGELQLIDVTDKSNPQFISSVETGKRFTHNAWISNNGDYVFTTDEVDGGAIEVYDISDRLNPELVESYKSRTLGDEMPHNVHVEDSIVVISYYKEGVIVLDGSQPDNLVELSRFDTDKNLSGPLSGGCWGVYPHFDSGRIIATDITKGLFVFGYNPLNAAYLEGIVLDAATEFPLNGVEVKVIGSKKVDYTSFTGEFKEGRVGNGAINVRFSLGGYLSDTLILNLQENKIVKDTVRLQKIPTIPLTVKVNLSDAGAGEGVYVALTSENYSYAGETDASGEISLPNFPIGDYEFHAGKWGYNNYCFTDSINATDNYFEFELMKGFFDDFSADQGWIASAVQEDVMWERVIPEPSINPDNGQVYDPPNDDAIGACDGYAYVTGNDSNLVSLSTTVNFTNFLVSPRVSFPEGNDNIEIGFSYYLGISDIANDSLHVGLVNGTDTLYYLALSNQMPTFSWESISFNTADLGWGVKPFQLIFKITDDLNPWDIVDASIDNVQLNFGPEGVDEVDACHFIHANEIRFYCGERDFEVYTIKGQVMISGKGDFIDMSAFKAGMYFVRTNKNESIKFLKSEN